MSWPASRRPAPAVTETGGPRRVPPASPRRPRRAARVLLAVTVLPILLGALVVLLLANTPWGNERVRRLLVSQANERLTGRLSVGRLRGNLLAGAVLTDVRVADSAGAPVFTARRAQFRYALLPALQGRAVIRSVTLDTPYVLLDKRPGARWNFQALRRRSGTPRDTARRGALPELGDVTINHGRLVYRRPWRPDSTLPADRRDAAIAAAVGGTARSRTERVAGGFQRVLEYRDIDARVPEIRLGADGAPTTVRLAALSMIAEPYRPPAIDVRSLTGTLYATKDSLWWRGARLALPASRLSGDGRVGFNKTGFAVDLAGAPLALADLRWLNPKLPDEGGGRLRFAMRISGDTADYRLADADVRYRDASIAGSASVSRVKPRGGKAEVLVRGADLTVARLTTDIVRELAPSVRLRRSGTLDGRVAVSGPSSALVVDADVRFDDRRAGRSHVVARGGVGVGDGVRARDLRVELRPLHVATLSGSGVSLPLGGTVSGTAVVNGGTREGWSVSGDLTHLEASNRSRVTGSGRYGASGGRVVADATLRPLSLATVGRFAPAAGLRGSVTGRVRAEGTTRDLRVSGALRSASGGGSLDGRGTVSLRGARTRYDVAVALDALNANAFSRRAPETRLTGRISARGRGTSPATANAVVAADLVRSRYDTFGVRRLTARLAVAGGLLRADTLVVDADGATARAGGTLGLVAGREGTMRVDVAVDSLAALRRWIGTSDSGSVGAASGRQRALLVAARADSARRHEASRIERLALGLPPGEPLILDTLPAIRRDSLAGSLTALATLRGSVKRLGVEATVRGRDLVARGNSVRALEADVSTADARDRSRPLAFRVNGEGVQAGGYGFEAVRVEGRWQDRRLAADVRVRQDERVSYAALGSWERQSSGGQLVRLDSLSARFDSLVWRLARPGAVAFGGGAMRLDSVDLRSSAGGRLFANGTAIEDGPVRLDVAAENVGVGTVLQAMQRDAEAADGALNATARVEGTRASPAITGTATLRDVRYGGTRAPDVDVDLRYAARVLALGANARDSSGRRVLVGRATLPLDLALAKIEGSRRLAGPLSADVALDSIELAALPLGSRAFADVRGRVAGEAHVRGSWRAPEYSGRAALRDASMLVTSTGMRIGGGVADLRIVGDTLRLDSLVARAKGTLRASGSVDLADRSRPFVRVSAEARDVRVLDARRGLVDVDGEVTAVGPLEAVRVTGRGEMLGGFLALKQFSKRLLRVKAPGDLSFFTVYDTTTPPAETARRAAALARRKRVGVIADLSMVVDRGSYYRNRPDANTEFYTGEGEEVLAHLDTRSGDSWAVGFVRIGGGVAIFRARRFEPARGTLTFSRYTGGPGFVQQVGERDVWEPGRGIFPLQLVTGGTSKAPAVGLESGTLFPIRGRELNSYLTMGRDFTSLLQQSGSSLSGSASWSGQLGGETGALARRQQAATALGVVLHDIGTGATKEYGLDALAMMPADVPTELVFGKTGGLRGALVEGGQYLTTDRYVAGMFRLTGVLPGARVSQLFGTAYRLDVGVEPRFLFRAPEDLGITHPTLRTGVFGVFLTRYWGF